MSKRIDGFLAFHQDALRKLVVIGGLDFEDVLSLLTQQALHFEHFGDEMNLVLQDHHLLAADVGMMDMVFLLSFIVVVVHVLPVDNVIEHFDD